jgi:hypothetical protein
MAEEPTPEQVNAAAEKAIGVFLAELGSDFSTGKFVLIAEAVDAESGKRSLWAAVADDQTPWDTMGLLTYMTSIEQGDAFDV